MRVDDMGMACRQEPARHRADESDAAYQRRLALGLIDSVGFDGAIRFCRNSAWEGVLQSILALRGRVNRA